MKPAVSVIVPCRNERDQVETCLRSILAQESPTGDFEVIIADGLSDDGTLEVLKELQKEDSRLRIIDNPSRIVATGLNSAIRLAHGDVIIRMDSHTRYASDYMRQCVAVLKETGADNVGGPWVAEGQGLISQAIAAAFQSAFSVGGARGHDPNYEGLLDTVYLGCWPREIFDRIGMFDEELVRNQDDEFNLRILKAGGRIWQSPRIKSWYTPRESLRLLFQQQRPVRLLESPCYPKAQNPCLYPASCSRLFCPLVDFSRTRVSVVSRCSLGLDRISRTLSVVQPRRLRSNGVECGLETFPNTSARVSLLSFRLWVWISARNFRVCILPRAPSHTYTKLTRTSGNNLHQKKIVNL